MLTNQACFFSQEEGWPLPEVSVIMTLRGGGGWESEGVMLTNQACFFSQEEGWPLPEKTLEEDHRCCKKALRPKHYAEVLATEGNSWRSSSSR